MIVPEVPEGAIVTTELCVVKYIDPGGEEHIAHHWTGHTNADASVDLSEKLGLMRMVELLASMPMIAHHVQRRLM